MTEAVRTPAERFAAELRGAEDRLRAQGLQGRAAYAALVRSLARRLGLPKEQWLDGPDAPASARLDEIQLTAELDLFGLAYERFFADVFKAERGQYFTPLPLVQLMVDLAELRPGDRVLDPTCGSGTFLVEALGRGADVDGIELDPELVALARINLKLRGANPRSIRQGDLFSLDEDDRWDVVLANPPFSLGIDDPDILARFELGTGRSRATSDVLFLEAALRLLRPGGRLVTVLPRSILVNDRYAPLRAWLLERSVRRAVVSLPEGVFRPFGGAASRACVLSLRAHPAEMTPWRAAVVRNPGYDPRRKVFKPTTPDDLARLRVEWRQGTWPEVAASGPAWVGEDVHRKTTVAPSVPVAALGTWLRHEPRLLRASSGGDSLVDLIDLADIDKTTGEVAAARPGRVGDQRGSKVALSAGDIVFARIRPELSNVAIVPKGAGRDQVGSSEWVRLRATSAPYARLWMARSPFVREQLLATAGQTRPRTTPDEILSARVPVLDSAATDALDAVVREAFEVRALARAKLDRASALYEAYGRGELDLRELTARLVALRS